MFSFSRGFLLVPGVLLSTLAVGCGGSMSNSGGGNPPPPVVTGNSAVNVLLSSTANNQLSQFTLNFSSITLTSKSGKVVNLLAAPQNAEFVHLNGNVEPFTLLSVPQDIYVSASAAIAGGSAVCINLNSSGGIQSNETDIPAIAASSVTINLPSSLNINGTHMGLLLDLQISQSVSFPGCDMLAQGPDTFTPTFNLKPVSFAAQPTNSSNGKINDLEGVIGTVDSMGQSFQLTTADGISSTLRTSGATVFQGISDFSGIVSRISVSVDAAIQADGSLLATRVAVSDTSAASLTTSTGPLLQVTASQPTLLTFGALQQGVLVVGSPTYFNFGDSTFQISGQIPNLKSLPFAASFTGVNMVPGQRTSLTTHASAFANGPGYVSAATVTLLPQTLNGMVTGVSNDGSFATYTIALAPYDLFSDLAVQQGQLSLLQSPNTVVAYVDSSVQMLNTKPLAQGNTLRFYGLVFNDNGTLKMNCAQISDGASQ